MSDPPDLAATTDDPSLLERIDRLIEDRVRAGVEQQLEELRAVTREPQRPQRATLVVFSGDMDRCLAAIPIATGAVAMGMDAAMYFTFWGLSVLRKGGARKKRLRDRMIAAMLPRDAGSLGTSRMNFLGLGPRFFRKIMRDKNAQSLPELMELARELGVRMVACQMSMEVLGLSREELVDGIEYGGVATYLGDASESGLTLFI